MTIDDAGVVYMSPHICMTTTLLSILALSIMYRCWNIFGSLYDKYYDIHITTAIGSLGVSYSSAKALMLSVSSDSPRASDYDSTNAVPR